MMAINQTRTTFFTPPLAGGKRRQITVRKNPRTLAFDAETVTVTPKNYDWAEQNSRRYPTTTRAQHCTPL